MTTKDLEVVVMDYNKVSVNLYTIQVFDNEYITEQVEENIIHLGHRLSEVNYMFSENEIEFNVEQ